MSNRVVLGALPDGGYGLRISKPGVNVLSVGELGQNISFDSRWAATSQIIVSGSVAVPNSGSTVTVSYGTTLSYIPVVLAMARDRYGTNRWFQVPTGAQGGDYSIDYGDGQSTSFAQANNFYQYAANLPPFMAVYNNRFTFNNVAPWAVDLLSYVVLRSK